MTAALAPSPRHPWEQLLAELTGRMGLTHGFGSEDDAKRAPVDHVTWIPGKPSFEARRFNVAGQEVSEILAVEHQVHVYGGSALVALQRCADLAGWMDLLAGPRTGSSETAPPRPGYDMRFAGKPVAGGAESGGAWLVVLTVTLKLFVVRQIYGATVVETFTTSTSAVDLEGSTAGPTTAGP